MNQCVKKASFFFIFRISDFFRKNIGLEEEKKKKKKKKKGNILLLAFMATVQLSWLFVWSAETTMSPSVCFFSTLMNLFTTGEENWFK